MTSVLESMQGAEAYEAETSNRLPVLAASIKANIVKSKESRAAWVVAEHRICIELAEVRARFPENDKTEFGKWLDENKVDIGHQNRAAYIAMGKEPERALQVLTTTTRSSIQHIFAHEWAITHVSKSPPDAKPARKEPEKVQRDRALAAVDRRKAAGENLHQDEVAKEAGVSAGIVQIAIAIREAEEAALAGAAKIEDIILSASAQEKFDAKLRAFQKAYKQQLDAEYQTKLTAAVRKWADEHRIPTYLKEIESVRKMLENRIKKGGVMPRKAYQMLLMCVHTDTARGRTDSQLNDAFHLLQKHEDMIVMDKVAPRIAEIYDMPTSKEEIWNDRPPISDTADIP